SAVTGRPYMAAGAIVTFASIFLPSTTRVNVIVLAFAALIVLLDGVKNPSEFRFFSIFTNSGVLMASGVFTAKTADSAFFFLGIPTAVVVREPTGNHLFRLIPRFMGNNNCYLLLYCRCCCCLIHI